MHGTQNQFWHTVEAKSMVSRGRRGIGGSLGSAYAVPGGPLEVQGGSCGGLGEPLWALGLPFGKVCWLLEGLCNALSALLGVLGGPLGTFGSTGEYLQGALSRFESTYMEPKAHFGRPLKRNHWFYGILGSLWKHWGALTWSPKLILAHSCNEVIGFKGDP